jgi:uncharacterized protein (TIGR02186 family)
MILRARFMLPLILCLAAPAAAQEAAAPAPAPVGGPESIQIGLSTNRIFITADFTGADLTIFGAIDNIDPLISRQGRYDIVVVLEGPVRPVVVRKKTRVLGVWVNTQSMTFVNVPSSYSVATTRALQDITTEENYRRLSLGPEFLYLQPADPAADRGRLAEFTAALRERKRAQNLYSVRVGGVEFLSQNLFRATVTLAPNIPVGTHKARAFLFRSGVFVKETSEQLGIAKAGFEQTIYRNAHERGLLYGFFAVALALLTGWIGRIVFRKD